MRVYGIQKDLKAAIMGMLLVRNNDLSEDSINKIKVIKRIMYGRYYLIYHRIRFFCWRDFILSTNFGKKAFLLDGHIRNLFLFNK